MAGLWLAAACGAGPESGPASEVRDSAGIRIVMNRAPASASPMQVALEPELVIGADDTDTTQILYQVRAARVLSDGRIVVAQASPPMVRWYDAQGRYLHGTGRPGGGPGEFGPGEGAWIMHMWRLPGDSIGTWEHSQRRMQVFDPSGRYARDVVLELPPAMPVGAYPQIVGRTARGFIGFLSAQKEDWPAGEIRRHPHTYMRYRDDGTHAGSFAELPGYVTFIMRLRMDGRDYTTEGRPTFAMVPTTAFTDDMFVYGSEERWEFEVRDTAGALRMLVRRPLPRRAVTDEMVAAYIENRMEGAPDDQAERARWRQQLEEAPAADSLPAYRLIRTDAAGMIWVQEYYDSGADTAAWSVFDRDGRWIGDVAIPTAWSILEIGEDYLLVRVADEFDVETIRLHRLRRH